MDKIAYYKECIYKQAQSDRENKSIKDTMIDTASSLGGTLGGITLAHSILKRHPNVSNGKQLAALFGSSVAGGAVGSYIPDAIRLHHKSKKQLGISPSAKDYVSLTRHLPQSIVDKNKESIIRAMSNDYE